MKFYCKKCNKYRRLLVKKLYDAQSGMLASVYCRKCDSLLYDWKVDSLLEDCQEKQG